MHLTSSTLCAFICKLGTVTYNTFNHVSQSLDRNITQLQCHGWVMGWGRVCPFSQLMSRLPQATYGCIYSLKQLIASPSYVTCHLSHP